MPPVVTGYRVLVRFKPLIELLIPTLAYGPNALRARGQNFSADALVRPSMT